MKSKIILFVFTLASALPAIAGTPMPDDTGTALPEPSTLGLFVAAAIAITVLTKFRK